MSRGRGTSDRLERGARPRRARRARARARGAVWVEILIAILPLLTFILGIFQLAELLAGRMLLDHAAFAAARSASVVVGDDPKHYVGISRDEVIKLAAVRALAPYALDGSFTKLEVRVEEGPKQLGAPGSVDVSATYKCHVPLVWAVVCDSNARLDLRARSTFASQATTYLYE